MFLKKLGFSKKQTDALTIATGIFIIGLLLIISMMVLGNNNSSNIDMFGYKFQVVENEVHIGSPNEDGDTHVELTDENGHDLEALFGKIKMAEDAWHAALRNGLIFLYLLAVLIIIFKNKETHIQGVVKGFLIGACILLLLFTLQKLMDVRSFLISYDHDIVHMFLDLH